MRPPPTRCVSDIAGDLQIEKTDGDIELTIGDGPFEYQLTVTNVGGASTGSPVTVTDVLPDEFEWVDFPDYCSQVDQVLTCDIDPTSSTPVASPPASSSRRRWSTASLRASTATRT